MCILCNEYCIVTVCGRNRDRERDRDRDREREREGGREGEIYSLSGNGVEREANDKCTVIIMIENRLVISSTVQYSTVLCRPNPRSQEEKKGK